MSASTSSPSAASRASRSSPSSCNSVNRRVKAARAEGRWGRGEGRRARDGFFASAQNDTTGGQCLTCVILSAAKNPALLSDYPTDDYPTDDSSAPHGIRCVGSGSASSSGSSVFSGATVPPYCQ